MSRIGKMPIAVPSGVEVTLEGQQVSVKGPKGTLSHRVAEPISVERAESGERGPARTWGDSHGSSSGTDSSSSRCCVFGCRRRTPAAPMDPQ